VSKIVSKIAENCVENRGKLLSIIVIDHRFQESGECVSRLTPENEGKEILVPLTGSMYVPGILSDPEHLVTVAAMHYSILKVYKLKFQLFRYRVSNVGVQFFYLKIVENTMLYVDIAICLHFGVGNYDVCFCAI
jgi:hypothetical protein